MDPHGHHPRRGEKRGPWLRFLYVSQRKGDPQGLVLENRGVMTSREAVRLDQRMQRLDRGLAALHGDKQVYRMRRQNIFVGDNPVLLQNLYSLERQVRRNATEASEAHRTQSFTLFA